MLKIPSPLVTVSSVWPLSFVTTTATPGMAPPALSTTVPEMDDVPCASTRVTDSKTARAAMHARTALLLSKDPPPETCPDARKSKRTPSIRQSQNFTDFSRPTRSKRLGMKYPITWWDGRNSIPSLLPIRDVAYPLLHAD